MIRYWLNGLLVFNLSVSLAFAEDIIGTDKNRGAMLYDNHCNQCHTQQAHWREKRIVTDWETLVVQVDRWQRTANLKWDKNDIKDVSYYLNVKFYHYP